MPIQTIIPHILNINLPQPLVASVGSTNTGSIFTITRLLGTSSTLSLITGTNSNLTLSGAVISAASALGNGTTQTAMIREVNGLIAFEYPLSITGVAASPTLNSLTLAATTAVINNSFTSTINGATTGSTITATSSDGTTLTVSGTSVSGTFTVAGSPIITLTETLGSATNSPKTSTITMNVSASGVVTLATLGASYAAVRGTQTMVSGYTGPLFKLRRETDNATQDFYALATGLPDINAINTWAGSSRIYPYTCYDQTGNGFNLVYPTINYGLQGGMAPIDTSVLTPSGGLWFISIDSSINGVIVSTGHSIDMQNHSFFTVTQTISGVGSTLGALDDGTNTLSNWIYGTGWVRDHSTANGYLTYTNGGPGQQVCRANPIVIGQTFNSSNRRLYLAETSTTAAAANSGIASRVVYGKNLLGEYANNIKWCGDVLTTAALSTTDGTSLQTKLASMFSIVTTFDRRLLLIGDSIDAGSVASIYGKLDYGKATWMRCNFTGSTEVIATAIPGQQQAGEAGTAASNYTNFSAYYAPFVVSKYGAGRMISLIQSGTNDFGLGSHTDTDVETTLQAMIRLIRAAYSSVKVIACQVLPRTNSTTAPWDSTREGYRTNYNTYLVNNADTYKTDLVIQWADPNSTMGSASAPTNATLYNSGDYLHPVNQGSTLR